MFFEFPLEVYFIDVQVKPSELKMPILEKELMISFPICFTTLLSIHASVKCLLISNVQIILYHANHLLNFIGFCHNKIET